MSSAVDWSPVIRKASFFKARACAWKSSETRCVASWPVGSVSVGSCTPLQMLRRLEGCPGSPAIIHAGGSPGQANAAGTDPGAETRRHGTVTDDGLDFIFGLRS